MYLQDLGRHQKYFEQLCRDHGIKESEIKDVLWDHMVNLFIDKYDPSRGRPSTFMATCFYRKFKNYLPTLRSRKAKLTGYAVVKKQTYQRYSLADRVDIDDIFLASLNDQEKLYVKTILENPGFKTKVFPQVSRERNRQIFESIRSKARDRLIGEIPCTNSSNQTEKP